MKNLLNLKFWFKLNPPALSDGGKYIIIGFIFLLFISIVIFWALKKRRKNLHTRFWSRLYSFSFTNFILGLVLYFFSYEQIPFFSTRIWYAVWGIGMMIWLYFILKTLKEIPEKKKQLHAKKEFEKYLP